MHGRLIMAACYAAAVAFRTPSVAVVNTGDHPCGPVRFAAAEVARAAAGRGISPDVTIEIVPGGPEQSYRIERRGQAWHVIGADAAGAMYGGLDIAEAIRLGSFDGLKPGERRPFIARRGLKFNIPLDLRTPSYSDNSDAAQANIPEAWSAEFWREFLDEMARHRFNVLTLWNLHPFPSIVRVPKFPDVALDDVLRGRRELFGPDFPRTGVGMFRPEFLDGG